MASVLTSHSYASRFTISFAAYQQPGLQQVNLNSSPLFFKGVRWAKRNENRTEKVKITFTGRSARERDPVTSSGPILLPNHFKLKVLFYLNYDEAVNFHRNVSNKHPNFAKLLSTIHFFVEEAVWVKIIINKTKPNPHPAKD